MSSLINEKEKILLELEEVFQEVARTITARFFQCTDQSLTPPQFFMLKRLASGPATVSEVAEYLGVSLSAVTSMADRMVKSNYVIRSRSEEDRRVVWLKLTDAGRKILKESSLKRKEVLHSLLGKLPEEDLTALHDIYTKLLKLNKD